MFCWRDLTFYWNKVEWNPGYGPRGTDLHDLYYCYLGPHRMEDWTWGYYCLPYDGQGHEAFAFGKWAINWSVLSSHERAYSEEEFMPWLPKWLRPLLFYKWPGNAGLTSRYSKAAEEERREKKRRKRSRSKPKWNSCTVGVHPRVLSGGGMMGDCLTCVNCGRDKYPEVFGVAVKTLPWPGGRTIDRSEDGRQAAWDRALQIEAHG